MVSEMVIGFFERYGLVMTLLATSGIIFVGFLKAIGLHSKLKKAYKKYVYFFIACITSIISCTIYMYITNQFQWLEWGMSIVCVISYTITIYSLYENLGIREFCRRIIFNPIKKLVEKIFLIPKGQELQKEDIIQIVKDWGSDVVFQIANEIKQDELEKSNNNNNNDTSQEIQESNIISNFNEIHFFS